jgi:hypothetical protein
MAARTPRMILWLVMTVISAGFLVVAGFWVWAVVTGGKYM